MRSRFKSIVIIAAALFAFTPNVVDADGPTTPKGLSGNVTATIPLEGVFKTSDGLQMRAREVTIAPGGRIPVHQHVDRPGVAYILEGEVTEHRVSEGKTVVTAAGTTVREQIGLTHWIENTGDKPARAFVVDIVPVK